MVTRQGGEAGGALGAARLAWLADGGSVAQVCLAPAVAQRFEPQGGAQADALHARHLRFARLYAAVQGEFAAA
jgi:xylulokinase